MHIEVWEGSGKQQWRWHKVNRGRIVSSAEGFPSKSNALRGAKADIVGTMKECGYEPTFELAERDGKTVLHWT